MSASGITMIALLPPSSRSVRPSRLPTTSPTRRPMRVLPVALISGRRRSASIVSPTSVSLPITKPNTSSARPHFGTNTSCLRITSCATLFMAIAVSGVIREGFQIMVSPHTAASMAFHAHTAAGKLNAVMMPIVPSGCHCSYMRWRVRSLCMESPYNCRERPNAKSAISMHSCTSPRPSA